MPLARLVFRMPLRHPGRTVITALGVAVTLLAFLTLRTLVASWYSVSEAKAKTDQLEVRHKISILFPVFKRMGDKILSVPGVQAVSPLIWYTGDYKNEKTRFGQLAVEEPYFKIHPEYVAPPDHMASYFADPAGALVGIELANRYGWKVGDKVTLNGTIYRGSIDLTVRAIYAGNDTPDLARLYFHYARVNPPDGHAHRLAVKAEPAAAKKIDALFANSDTPTKTESQLSVQRSWAAWSSSVVVAIQLAAVLVLLVLVPVLGNAMAMAARDGMREHAAMRAMGYRPRHIRALIVAQGLVTAGSGIVVGICLAPSALHGFSQLMEKRLGGSWQLTLDPKVTLLAVATVVGVSLISSALPAWRSTRMPIAIALRRVA